MANRMFWEKFWYRDFFDDVRRLSAGARGLWISILCEMWGNGRLGELAISEKELIRLSGAVEENIEDYLLELYLNGVCDFINRDTKMIEDDFNLIYDRRTNDNFLIIRNRRLFREAKRNESHNLAQKRYLEKIENDKSKIQKRSTDDGIEERRAEDRREKKEEKSLTANDERPPFLPSTLTKEENTELKSLLGSVRKRFSEPGQPPFNPYSWISANVGLHPKTKLLVMRQLSTQPNITNPHGYAAKIAVVEDGNYNEMDSIEESERHKEALSATLTELAGGAE